MKLIKIRKEIGSIRRRFGRNVGIQKRLKYYTIIRLFECIFDAIRFKIVFLIPENGEVLPQYILFLQIRQHDPFGTKINKFKNIVVSGILTKEFTASIYKTVAYLYIQ